MSTRLKIAWVLGWATPVPWFAPLARAACPPAEHTFFPAAESTLSRLRNGGPWDEIIGYSLGAHLLLASPAQVTALGPVMLLAPIFAFSREDDLGGRVARTQVRVLARWLKRDPRAALADFYQRAGLDIPLELAPTDDTAALAWGLERLAADRVEPPLPAGWQAWCGANDPLLDATRLRALDSRIATVKEATHHPPALLHAMVTHRRDRARSDVAERRLSPVEPSFQQPLT